MQHSRPSIIVMDHENLSHNMYWIWNQIEKISVSLSIGAAIEEVPVRSAPQPANSEHNPQHHLNPSILSPHPPQWGRNWEAKCRRLGARAGPHLLGFFEVNFLNCMLIVVISHNGHYLLFVRMDIRTYLMVHGQILSEIYLPSKFRNNIWYWIIRRYVTFLWHLSDVLLMNKI